MGIRLPVGGFLPPPSSPPAQSRRLHAAHYSLQGFRLEIITGLLRFESQILPISVNLSETYVSLE
jgi:hypothetical protein